MIEYTLEDMYGVSQTCSIPIARINDRPPTKEDKLDNILRLLSEEVPPTKEEVL